MSWKLLVCLAWVKRKGPAQRSFYPGHIGLICIRQLLIDVECTSGQLQRDYLLDLVNFRKFANQVYSLQPVHNRRCSVIFRHELYVEFTLSHNAEIACSWIFLFRRLLLLLLLKCQSIAKRNARGDLANSNWDCYTQKCTAFMPLGPTLMQMSTGLTFSSVSHVHCHFCICRCDVYLVMHFLQYF